MIDGFLEVLFVFVIIQLVIFDDVEFYRIESDDFKFRSALLARYRVALIGVRIDMHIGIAFGACSGWHFVSTSSAFRRSALVYRGDLHLEVYLFELGTI